MVMRYAVQRGYQSLTLQHGTISSVGYGEHVGRHLVSLDSFVPLHDFFRVDRQLLVRVYDHAEKTGIRLERKLQIVSQ